MKRLVYHWTTKKYFNFNFLKAKRLLKINYSNSLFTIFIMVTYIYDDNPFHELFWVFFVTSLERDIDFWKHIEKYSELTTAFCAVNVPWLWNLELRPLQVKYIMPTANHCNYEINNLKSLFLQLCIKYVKVNLPALLTCFLFLTWPVKSVPIFLWTFLELP